MPACILFALAALLAALAACVATVSRAGRGTGRIVEGCASGKLIHYEIEGSKGERFMAHERELRYQ